MGSLWRAGLRFGLLVASASLSAQPALAAYPDCLGTPATPGAVTAWRAAAANVLKVDYTDNDDGGADASVAAVLAKCYPQPQQMPQCMQRMADFVNRTDNGSPEFDLTAAQAPEKQPPKELLAPNANGLQYIVPPNIEEIAKANGWPAVRYKSRHSGGFDSVTASLLMVYVPGDKVNPPVNYDRWLNFAMTADTGADAHQPVPRGRIPSSADFAAEAAAFQALQQAEAAAASAAAVQQQQQQQHQNASGAAVAPSGGTVGGGAGDGAPAPGGNPAGSGTGSVAAAGGTGVAPAGGGAGSGVAQPNGTPSLPGAAPSAAQGPVAPPGAALLDNAGSSGGAVAATGTEPDTSTATLGGTGNTPVTNPINNAVNAASNNPALVEFPRVFTMVSLDKATDSSPAKVYFQLFHRDNYGSPIYTPAGNAGVDGCNSCHPNGMRAISPLGYHVRAGEQALPDDAWNTVKLMNDAMDDDANNVIVSWRDAQQVSGGAVKAMLHPTAQYPWYGPLKPLNPISRTQAYIMGGTLPDGTTTPGCYKLRPSIDVSDIFGRPPGDKNVYTLSASPQINWMKVKNAMRCEQCHNNRMRDTVSVVTQSDEVDFKILVDQSMPMGAHQNPLDQGSSSTPVQDSLTPDERIALANCLQAEMNLEAPLVSQWVTQQACN